jgi:hypothetical protein
MTMAVYSPGQGMRGMSDGLTRNDFGPEVGFWEISPEGSHSAEIQLRHLPEALFWLTSG